MRVEQDGPSPQQIERYRAMTPAQRLQAAFALNHEARRLRAAYERTQHPEWTEEQIAAHVKRVFLFATT